MIIEIRTDETSDWISVYVNGVFDSMWLTPELAEFRAAEIAL